MQYRCPGEWLSFVSQVIWLTYFQFRTKLSHFRQWITKKCLTLVTFLLSFVCFMIQILDCGITTWMYVSNMNYHHQHKHRHILSVFMLVSIAIFPIKAFLSSLNYWFFVVLCFLSCHLDLAYYRKKQIVYTLSPFKGYNSKVKTMKYK